MNFGIVKSRRARRSLVSGAGLLVLVAFTPDEAFACLDICIQKYGSLTRKSEGVYWELDSCTQRYNSTGGVTTTCYYNVIEV